jgi:large subunit ribosomal protein L32
MGVPKKHKTRSGRDQRRSHHHLEKQTFATCKNCNSPVRPHTVCANCGHYKGRAVIKT